MTEIKTKNSTVHSKMELPMPTRRLMVAGLAAVGAMPLGVCAAQASGPDGRLIDLCRQHATLSRLYNGLFTSERDDNRRDAAQRPILARQQELEAVIYRMHATTPAGLKARAQMALEHAPGVLEDTESEPDPDMIRALLRDLAALNA